MPRVSCWFRDVATGEPVCIDPSHAHHRPANRCTRTDPHRCELGRHRERPSARIRVAWRRLRDGVLCAWIAAWLVAGLYALLLSGPAS